MGYWDILSVGDMIDRFECFRKHDLPDLFPGLKIMLHNSDWVAFFFDKKTTLLVYSFSVRLLDRFMLRRMEEK